MKKFKFVKKHKKHNFEIKINAISWAIECDQNHQKYNIGVYLCSLFPKPYIFWMFMQLFELPMHFWHLFAKLKIVYVDAEKCTVWEWIRLHFYTLHFSAFLHKNAWKTIHFHRFDMILEWIRVRYVYRGTAGYAIYNTHRRMFFIKIFYLMPNIFFRQKTPNANLMQRYSF